MAISHEYQRVKTGDDVNGDFDAETTSPSAKANKHAAPRPLPWLKKPSVFWLLPVFLVFNLAMGATSMPRTSNTGHRPRHGVASHPSTMNGMGQANSSSPIIIGEFNAQCSTDQVESATAIFTLYGNLIAGIIGALTAPLWGTLSDKFGRIKPLAAASTILWVSELVMVLVARLPDALPVNWLFLTYLLEGLSGTFILIMALASAYAADCTSHSERSVALGWFHGSMFFGFAAGPLLGGFLGMSNGQSRPMLVFNVALVIRFLGIIFLICLVPESLVNHPQRDEPHETQTMKHHQPSIFKSMFVKAKHLDIFRIFRASTILDAKVRRNLLVLAGINTIMFGAFMGAMNVLLLYSEYVFGWGNKESGIFLSVVNLFRTIASMIVLPLAIRFLRPFFSPNPKSHRGTKPSTGTGFDLLDLTLIRISIISDIIGFIGYASSPTGFLFTLSGVIAALGAIGLAISEASMTKLVGPRNTGELLGALSLLQAMARIVAPTIASLTYSWTVATVPQLVFWGVAGMFAMAGVLTVWARPQRKGRGRGRGFEEEEEGEEGDGEEEEEESIMLT